MITGEYRVIETESTLQVLLMKKLTITKYSDIVQY